MKKEVSLNDLFDVINEVKDKVESLDKKVDGLDKKIEEVIDITNAFATSVDEKFVAVDERLDELEKKTTRIESQMVTKDYLDEKLADLRGDMVVLVRKEDTKMKKLIDILYQKKVLSADDAKQINAMEPFPQLAL